MTRLFKISLIIAVFCLIRGDIGQCLTASWYDQASCRKEGTSGICADGTRLDDSKNTCASWDYPFGTKLIVTNLKNNKSVVVTVTDRGPNKKLYRRGRVIDLSKNAFATIAPLSDGVINVSIKRKNYYKKN